MNRKEFVKVLAEIIASEVNKRGYDQSVARAIVAQACLESAWGASSLASKYHNYFGMKCGSKWKGKSVNLSTKEEYVPGTLTKIKDNFRVYDNMRLGIEGYFDFINTKRYSNLKSAKTPRQYVEMIKSDGWATSTRYVDSVMAVYSEVVKIMEEHAKQQDQTDNIDKIARDVIAGLYGNGARRRAMLGANFRAVQDRVNEILKGK